MSIEGNKAIACRVWNEVFNQRKLSVADELVAADGVNYEAPPGIPDRGPESLKAAVNWLTAAFPDLHAAIDDVVAEGDKVVVLLTLSGTHKGPFMHIAPTGRRFAQRQVHMLRVRDDKVVEHSAIRDDVAMLKQLGGHADRA
jgi:ketosteroid isomerase-like protein